MKIGINKEYELAHEYYEKEKNEIMTKLHTIATDVHLPKVYSDWLEQAIEFIKEGEI